MTTAAKRFLDAVEIAWDSPAEWEATAERGLSSHDLHVMRCFACEAHERPSIVEKEILSAIRAKVEIDKAKG